MTTRMTVALSVLTLGLAIAALAGLPALIENREVGDVVVIVGFAVAIVGVLLVILAVPGQRRETGKLKSNDAIELAKLGAERRRLASTARQTERAIDEVGWGDAAPEGMRLKTALIELEAALEVNAAEFRRYGIEDPDERATLGEQARQAGGKKRRSARRRVYGSNAR
ncbi:MAG: hypothetical protein PIR02_11885 [Microbacterium enclense]